MRPLYTVGIVFVLLVAMTAGGFAYISSTTPTTNEECNAGATFPEGKAMECPRGCVEQSFSRYDKETATEEWGSVCVLDQKNNN